MEINIKILNKKRMDQRFAVLCFKSFVQFYFIVLEKKDGIFYLSEIHINKNIKTEFTMLFLFIYQLLRKMSRMHYENFSNT